MQTFDICFSLDNDYVEQLAVAVASIIKSSNDNESFNFYVLDGGISDLNKKRISALKKYKNFNLEYIKINYDDFESCPMLKEYNENYTDYHTTKPTYFRFKLPSVFSKLDKILYLDCDIVVNGSLSELYNQNIDNYYAAMVKDVDCEIEQKRLNINNYYNAGMMLINLELWRENDIENKLFDFVQNNKDILLWQDQDVVNILFDKKILELSNTWNFQIAKGDFENPNMLCEFYEQKIILHFAGRYKPWLNLVDSPVFEVYYNYLAAIPWLDNVKKYNNQWLNLKLKQSLYDGLIREELQKAYDYFESYKFDVEKKLDMVSDSFNNMLLKEYKKIYKTVDEHKEDLYKDGEKIYTAVNECKNDLYKENEKIYDYVTATRKDVLGLFDMKFKDINDCYFSEQTKIYEYINSQVANINNHFNDKLNQYETHIKEQQQKIEFLENKITASEQLANKKEN